MGKAYENVSAISREVGERNDCGAYDEGMQHIRDATMRPVWGYDPYNRTAGYNRFATTRLAEEGSRTVVLCSNVLNVIREPEARHDVLLECARAALALFTVYEGDGTGRGRETSKGWQEHRKTADYLREIESVFPHVARKGKVIVAGWDREEVRKALAGR